MFVVINYTSATATAGAVFGTGAANQAYGLTARPKTGVLMLQAWGTRNDMISTTPGVGAGWMIQSSVLNNSVSNHYKDGVLIGSKSRTYNTVLNRFVLGREIANLGYMDGDIAAVLVYDRALSAEERQTVDAYLHSKYFAPTGG